MQPRTLGILVGSILLLGIVMRVVIAQTGILPISEEVVLKKATALTIAYRVQGQVKTLMVDRLEDLEEAFAVLHLERGDSSRDRVFANGGPMRGGVGGGVTFHFPDRTQRQLPFEGRTWLGQYRVDPRFYERLCALVSRAEKRRVEILDNAPGEVPGQ